MEKHVDHALEAQRAIDHVLAEQDADLERLKAEAEARGLTDDVENHIYWNWIHKIVTTEADIKIEGSPDVVIFDPNQRTLWD